MIIESLSAWNGLSHDLLEFGYAIWQMQYRYNCPEGFHVWFWADGCDTVEVVTHSQEVYEAIMAYRG